MRIKSGYISGFGKLNNYPLVFENDLFSLCEENGFGKTTICEFIGAMFYGLPELKSSSKSDNLRGKYAPLGGSLFGGSLTVCDDFGKEYRIEREFSKTGSKDSLKMFDEMGNALEIYKSPGEMLFGLDKDAYERTLSMHFTLDESFDNPTISAKLNNLFINSSEDVSVDEALNEIKKELKEYEGKHGLITLNDAEIKKVLKQLDEIEALDKLYRKDYHLYGDLKMELAELKRKSEKALLEKEMKRKGDEVEAERKHIEERKALNDEKIERYKNKFMSDEEVNGLFELLNTEKGLTRKLEELKLFDCEEELRKIQSNFDKFSDFDEKFNEADYNLRKAEENYSLYQSVVRNELPEEIADKIVKISDGKQLNIKQAGEVIEIMEDVNKTIELGIRDAKDIFLKKKKLYPLFSFLLLFAGLGVSLYSLISIKYLFLIPGIAFVFTSFIFGYLTIINNRNFEDFTRIANPYGDPIIILGIGALNMYIEYSLKISNFLENFEDLRAELENVRYREALSKLMERYNKYKELERLNTENKKAVLAASDEISETRKKINDILFSHEITENCDVYETINMLQNIRREVEATQKYIEEDLRNLEKKVKAYGIEKNYEYEFLPMLSEIEDEMVSKNREINRLEKTLDELREEIDNKEVLSLQLSELNEKAEKYKNETYILKCTAELIEKTNEALMDKYFKPVFESYKELEKNFLSNNIVPGMKIRKDYSLSFEIEGKETNEKHLSTGQQICAKVLLKYAIVKMMFKSDKPFVILDDPFATLDEKNLEDAKKLVKTLSKDMQTFYFTCHKSRAI